MDERARRVYAEGVKRVDCSRGEAVTLAQLRVGQCSKTHYWRQNVGWEERRSCQDCGEDEDRDHWLCCVRWARERWEEGLGQGGEIPALGDEGRVLRFLRRCHKEWWRGGSG